MKTCSDLFCSLTIIIIIIIIMVVIMACQHIATKTDPTNPFWTQKTSVEKLGQFRVQCKYYHIDLDCREWDLIFAILQINDPHDNRGN